MLFHSRPSLRLRQSANAAAFSAYAGPAPGWENERGERGRRGGFPANIASPFKSHRNMEESNRFYEKLVISMDVFIVDDYC